MKTKILLLSPPSTPEEEYKKFRDLGNIQQPLGLAYLAAVLEQSGREVKIIDPNPLKLSGEDIINSIKKFRPDIIGISSSTPNFLKAIDLCKKIKKTLNVPIIIGGTHITSVPEEILKYKCFDFGIIGEGETTILELVEKIENKEDVSNVKGIAYNDGGKLNKTEPRELIKDLDSLPFPARHLIPPLEKYMPTRGTYKRLPLGTIITSRGCPYRCSFCNRAIFGNKFRHRSEKNVVDEIEILIKKFNAKEIKFWDDAINVIPERLINICNEILRRGIKIPWSCIARINGMDEPLLKKMKEAGCWQISYGIESENQKILDNIKKDLTISQIKEVVSTTNKAGIRTRGFFMLGLPGETKETMQQTINFSKSLMLDIANFYITTPYPSTDLYEDAKKSGELKKASYNEYLTNFPDEISYVPNGLTAGLIKEYQWRAYKSFYLRLQYVIKQLFRINSMEDLLNKLKNFLIIAELKK